MSVKIATFVPKIKSKTYSDGSKGFGVEIRPDGSKHYDRIKFPDGTVAEDITVSPDGSMEIARAKNKDGEGWNITSTKFGIVTQKFIDANGVVTEKTVQ